MQEKSLESYLAYSKNSVSVDNDSSCYCFLFYDTQLCKDINHHSENSPPLSSTSFTHEQN